MKITFLGHSGFLIQIGTITLVIDPYITDNPKATHLNLSNINPDYILITHAHFDHILDVESLAKANNALIISNHEIANYYAGKGFETQGMNIGGRVDFDFGTLKMVTAVHSSSFPDGTYGGVAGGFVIEGEHKNCYFSGDTALTQDMKLIPLQTSLDVAILPIGDLFTMNYADAILASDFVQCDKIIGCHFDTFPPIEVNHELVKKAFFDKGKDLMLLEIGESIEI
jgi:L-ascorbate metabolism protein UlaG (beta-lactamase superfamily)